MSVSKTEEKKCRDIQVMKDAGYVNKLCYITAEAATGCILDLTSEVSTLSPEQLFKKAYNCMAVKLLMFSVS